MALDKDKLFGDKKLPHKEMIKRCYFYLKPERAKLILALILVAINVILDIILPYFISKVTNLLKVDDTTTKFGTILIFVFGFLLISLVNQVFIYFESMILAKAGQRIVYKLRMDVFTHIESMSLNQLNEMPVGSLVTRVASYTSQMSDLFTGVLISMIRNILTIVAVYAAMLFLSTTLALIMLIFVALVFTISVIFRSIISKLFRKERAAESDMNTFLSENLSAIKLIQAFNQEKRKINEFKERNRQIELIRYKVMLAFALYRPGVNLLYYLSIAATFYFSLYHMSDYAVVVAFYLYLSKFFNPVQELADTLNRYQRAMSSCERLFNLLDVKPDVLDSKDSVEIDHFIGKIEFRHVWFSYDDKNYVLKDVSFVINPKTTCAFVGATGSGKTTILSLIVRNYEIQKGEILIDDINIKNIKIDSLRRAIGQMLQDVFLFSGTIKSNITLKDEFSDNEIIEVCRYVNADKFINTLPNKYDEVVTEKGDNYSTGQRQLLSFARTIIHKPQILILDEATANIDTETESIIQDSLKKMKEIGTMIVVAHRLSTIQHSDNIIVLKDGEIIEQGNHQELLKHKSYYYRLYQIQFENN